MLGPDVRSEDRGADDPPTEVAAREEVVGSSILAAACDPPGNAQQDGEVTANCQPVPDGDGKSIGLGGDCAEGGHEHGSALSEKAAVGRCSEKTGLL